MDLMQEQYEDYAQGKIQMPKKKAGTLSKVSFWFSVSSVGFFLMMLLAVQLCSSANYRTNGLIMMPWGMTINMGVAADVTGIISAILGKKHNASITFSIAALIIGVVDLLILFVMQYWLF